MIRARLAYWWACLVCAGYRIRPYDMLADRRHWVWQRPMRCGLGALPAAARAELVAAVHRMMDR